MLTIDSKPGSEIVVDNYKKIPLENLKNLGYRLSGKQIPLGAKPYRHGIMEVKNEKDDDLVSFSYLYSVLDETGVILPYGYDYYSTHPFC